jgi:hypothetical protein
MQSRLSFTSGVEKVIFVTLPKLNFLQLFVNFSVNGFIVKSHTILLVAELYNCLLIFAILLLYFVFLNNCRFVITN